MSNTAPSTKELKSMQEYLKGHFRYEGAYANNIKVHHVIREYDPRNYEALGNEQLMEQVFDTLEDFSTEHPYLGCYTAGRSGGYLVLHARKQHFTGHQSYCRCCGQRNFRSVIEVSSFGLEEGHRAWPMVNEMIRLTGMSGGNPQYQSDYFAQWARNSGGVNMSYFDLFALAEKLMPMIVGKGSVIKCGRCGSPEMVNYAKAPFHWVSAGAVNDTAEDIDEMDDNALVERYNLIKAFDQATQDLIAEFKYQAENWDVEDEDAHHVGDDVAQERLAA